MNATLRALRSAWASSAVLVAPAALMVAALVGACAAASGADTAPRPGPEGITTGARAGPELASHPEGILSPASIRGLQRALRQRGIDAPVSGAFDRPTEEALRVFQRESGLAETGMPSMATLRALGLDPAAIYSSTEPARGQTQPWWRQPSPREPGDGG